MRMNERERERGGREAENVNENERMWKSNWFIVIMFNVSRLLNPMNESEVFEIHTSDHKFSDESFSFWLHLISQLSR
jgi:hypothetical protein